MEKKLIVIKHAEQPPLKKTDRTSFVFTIIALVMGLSVSVVVGQVGWVALIIIPGLVVVLSATANPDLGIVALVMVIFTQFQTALVNR